MDTTAGVASRRHLGMRCPHHSGPQDESTLGEKDKMGPGPASSLSKEAADDSNTKPAWCAPMGSHPP